MTYPSRSWARLRPLVRPRVTVTLVAAVLTGTLAWAFVTKERRLLLPGTTSNAHHVFDQACDACHQPFQGPSNERCTHCHRSDLEQDRHSVALFDDPRWAVSLAKLDATRCVTCHSEHRLAARNVTIAAGFCFECHDEVVERRESHRGFAPASCQSSGCHNYHDDQGLNSAFLSKRLGQPDTHAAQPVLAWGRAPAPGAPVPTAKYPPGLAGGVEAERSWLESAHAAARVGCNDCHNDASGTFVERPATAVCQRCHTTEMETFQAGKHGIRTALGLAPLRVADARLPMKAAAAARSLTCATCHDPHTVDTRRAAIDACLGCHDDGHSRAFGASKHAGTAALSGRRHAAAAVTCATCHLARVQRRDGSVFVDHNNSRTLRPRDRMLRAVCLNCHGLEFALGALLEDGLIATNFGAPARHVPETVRMVKALVERESQTKETHQP